MSQFKDIGRKPEGSGKFAIWIKRVHEMLFGGRFPFLDSDTVKWIRTNRGYSANVVRSPAQNTPIPVSMMPFKIYNIGNTQNPADNWRTFQIRNGIIGWRSQNAPGALGGQLYGNFETPTLCYFDSAGFLFDRQPTANLGAQVALKNNGDTLIFDPGTHDLSIGAAAYPQILVDPTFDDAGEIQASFWVTMVDEKSDLLNPLRPQLWGRMFTVNEIDSTGRTQQAFPIGPQITVLGTVRYDKPDQTALINQMQWGNLVNRMAPSAPLISPVNSPNQMRGAWQEDNLSGEMFYPGDIVIDDTVPFGVEGNDPTTGAPLGTNTFFAVYQYINGNAQVETDAPIGNEQWRYVYSKIDFSRTGL